MAGIGIDTTKVSTAVDVKDTKSGSSLDKDAFLKLLVTQMQYQDPLEPTSNTEYMAQLAQFSTVEELQNLSSAFSTSQSMNMAGQYVILNVPDATGDIKQVTGLVDYVTLKEGSAYFHINDDYYPADYLDSIVSLDYLEHLINSNSDTEQTVNGQQDENSDGANQTDDTDTE
ncbi:MAG: hypothetical protein IJ801_02845 [Lachnospiraceae bacterium]|nr:hypothetical protein [Lachnospiraceae bacterium]